MGIDVSACVKRAATCAVVVVCGVLSVATEPASAEVMQRLMRVGATSVQYKIVLPDGYDTAKAYPAVLVMGGGPQTMDTVDRTLERNFRAEAERRGYIVVAPAVPGGELFFQGGERIFPEFLETILANYRIVDRKFHVAGPSNGGIAAMHVAAQHPKYFFSATAFPGYLWRPTEAKLKALTPLCVFLYVGEHDEYRWHDEMRREADALTAAGTVARYSLEQGQGHRLETLGGANAARLFDDFEQARRGCKRQP
jgi:poly(3-hydroxybutyrate) depolymerase